MKEFKNLYSRQIKEFKSVKLNADKLNNFVDKKVENLREIIFKCKKFEKLKL